MKEKRQKSGRQRIASVLICVGVGWLVYIAAMNLFAWHFALKAGRAYPNLDVVTRETTDRAVAELSGVRIERFGLSFRVPWKEIDHDRTVKLVSSVSFKGGRGLIIFDPAFKGDGAKTLRGTTPQQQKTLGEVFGQQTLSSNYELMAAATRVTPSDVKWWAGRTRNTRSAILLVNKWGYMNQASAIYRIASSTMRGFQFGDPGSPPYLVKLELFDSADKQYEIYLSCNEKSPCISQAEINGLIASLRVLPPSSIDLLPSSGD